jgi:hypothetical protein
MSTAPMVVTIRFALYMAQNAILVYWILALAHLL